MPLFVRYLMIRLIVLLNHRYYFFHRVKKNLFGERPLLILLTLFMIGIPSFAREEGYAIIEKDHRKGLVNNKGRVVIPPEYEDLGWSTGEAEILENVIGFKKDGLWGILNTKNERITQPVYTSLARFNDNWIVASKKLPYNSNIVFGVINAKGNAETPFQYQSIEINEDQLIASMEENGKFSYGVLEAKGKEIIPIIFDEIEPQTSSLYQVVEGEKAAVFHENGKNLTFFTLDSTKAVGSDYVLTFKNGKKGLIANNGDVVIPPEYKNIKMENGVIKAQRFDTWKAFDNANHLLTSYSYDDIVPKGEKLYKVRLGSAQALIHSSDSLLTEFSNFDIQEHFGDWISVKKNGNVGVLRMDGKMLLEPKYDSIRYVQGVFLVKNKIDGKRGWSMVNRHGVILTDQVYDTIEWLGDSFFKAKRDKFWGVLNILGKETIFCKYDSVLQYSEGRLLVNFLGEDGILNLDGNWEILPQNKEIEIVDPMRYLVRSPYGSFVAYYPETKDFTAEYFLYKHGDRYLEKTLDEKFGLLDENGKRVIHPVFDEISPLQEDSIYFARSAKGYSFITKSGKVIHQNDRRFEQIQDMSEEFIGVMIDGKWGFVDINGKLRVSNQYDEIGRYNEGLAPYKLLGRWGYIDKWEDIIVQPRYDSVSNFKAGLCVVVNKGKFGLINAKGKITLECEYDNLYRLKTGGFLTLKDKKYGLAGKDGRLLILPRFDQMNDLNNGFVIASRKGKYGLMSNDGVNIIPMIYDALRYDKFNDVYLASTPSEWIEIPQQ